MSWEYIKARIKINQETDCWEWQRSTAGEGYGQFATKATGRWYPHRYVYFLEHGEIPEDKVVMHSCDNRLCCNPKHLVLGTQADNIEDKVKKNRHLKGSQITQAILNEQQVKQILKDSRSHQKIADEYGVCRTAITLIKLRKNWAHVSISD